MKKPLLALSLSVLAVFGWAHPIAHSAPPPASETSAEPLALGVDVSELPEAERGVGPVLLEQLRSIVEAGGIEITDDPGAATVLQIRVRLMEAGDRNYGIHFEFVEGDSVVPAAEWTDCVFCTEARMLQKLESKQDELYASIQAHQEASVDADTGEDSGAEGDGGHDDGGVEPLPKPIGPIGVAGAAASVVGLGVIVWGAVEVSRGRVYDHPAGAFKVRTGVDHAPRGYVLVGVGAAVASAGLVLLGVDVARRAKQRKRARSQALVVPLFSPTGLGLGVSGSF
ncbi:hypothetical protein [Enhygromyxa salina]|uniref:Uncharacterized protein n=1 Tax=Enhygromyxa salina TaxID=215803 RepID=A0A2S9Y4B0_9BACT|nr:hypothetical protein [Enhygromyxa salina]PRP99915.1 hypothetical protein ENSA7_61320 [Enhygromyxa salina]